MKHSFILYIFMLSSFFLNAQNDESSKINAEFGFAYRSPALRAISSDPSIPFVSEKNLQGIGGHIGLAYIPNIINLSLAYYTNVRYDHLRSSQIGTGNNDIKGWFVDHSFAIRYNLKNKVESIYFSLEWNALNVGSNFQYQIRANGEIHTHELDFKTISFALGVPIKSLVLESKISLVPRDNPYTLYNARGFNFLTFKLFYPLNMLSF